MINDLISKQDVIDAINNVIAIGDEQLIGFRNDTVAMLIWQLKKDAMKVLKYRIKEIPSAEPQNADWSEYSDKLWKRAYEKGKADVESQEHKIGEWIYDWGDQEFETCKCSECGNHMTTPIKERYKYCPNCGAHMIGVEDG